MPVSRSKGVFERPKGSGKWWIRIPRGDGTYRRESVGTYEEACAEYAARMKPAAAGPSLREAMARFLALRPHVNHAYRSHANYFNRRFPGITLAEFATIGGLRAWQTERLQERSRATVNHQMAFLSGVFHQAIDDELLEDNLIGGKGRRRLAYLAIKKGRQRWISEEEEDQLREHFGEDDWEAIEFAIHTGLRRSEQWRLQWHDWQADELWVEAGKTNRGRTVYLNAEALAILNKRKARGLTRPFPATSPRRMAAKFNAMVKQIGKADLSWHCTRHTMATRMVRSGVNMRTIQRLCGWSSLAMVERYGHVTDADGREAVRRLSRQVRS